MSSSKRKPRGHGQRLSSVVSGFPSRGLKLPGRWRLLVLVLAVLAAGVVVGWMERMAWRQVDALRGQFRAVQVGSFHLADHLQATVRGLNDLIVRFDLQEEEEDREQFFRDAAALQQWMAEKKPHLSSERELAQFERIEAAFADYLASGRRLIEKSAREPGPGSASVLFARLEDESAHLLGLSREFGFTQRDALNEFHDRSYENLLWLQSHLLASLTLLILLSSALAVYVYRGMIAPLHLKLIESRAVIERQEKLASLGVLAAGVAHEIRNPLTAIRARLFSLKRSLGDRPVEREDASVIDGEIDRLERIVKDILQFARPSEPSFITLPAEAVLREVHGLLAEQLERRSIRFECDAPGETPVRVDPAQIKQVLINLVQNAAESIERDGSVQLRAEAGTFPLAGRAVRAVALEVEDNGRGISPAVQRRLFDPFFTTKEGGTGLGLSIAARIVEKHGGELQYQTRAGRGTLFRIVLPAGS